MPSAEKNPPRAPRGARHTSRVISATSQQRAGTFISTFPSPYLYIYIWHCSASKGSPFTVGLRLVGLRYHQYADRTTCSMPGKIKSAFHIRLYSFSLEENHLFRSSYVCFAPDFQVQVCLQREGKTSRWGRREREQGERRGGRREDRKTKSRCGPYACGNPSPVSDLERLKTSTSANSTQRKRRDGGEGER